MDIKKQAKKVKKELNKLIDGMVEMFNKSVGGGGQGGDPDKNSSVGGGGQGGDPS